MCRRLSGKEKERRGRKCGKSRQRKETQATKKKSRMTECGRASRREEGAVGVAGEREGDGDSKRACVIIRCERRLSIRLRSQNKRSGTRGQRTRRKKRADEEKRKKKEKKPDQRGEETHEIQQGQKMKGKRRRNGFVGYNSADGLAEISILKFMEETCTSVILVSRDNYPKPGGRFYERN